MSRNKRQLLATKKQMLIKRIEQQRSDLTASSKDWLQTTERYDRTWKFFITFRPLFIAATGILSIYSLKKPQKLLRLGKKALTIWSLARTVQSTLNASKK